MDNRMDNLTLVPKWVSKSEQDRILQSRSTESHFWDNNRRRRIPQQQHPPNGGMLGGGLGGAGIIEEDNMLSDHELEEQPSQQRIPRGEDKGERRKGENSLYWKAITQLLANETEEVSP